MTKKTIAALALSPLSLQSPLVLICKKREGGIGCTATGGDGGDAGDNRDESANRSGRTAASQSVSAPMLSHSESLDSVHETVEQQPSKSRGRALRRPHSLRALPSEDPRVTLPPPYRAGSIARDSISTSRG